MRILGITGPIGCGKSTVARLTKTLGALEVIDADACVHELMRPGTELTARIVGEFGPEVQAADGAVNRPLLGERVFGDRPALRRLEDLVDPAVRQEIRTRITSWRSVKANGVVVVEAIRLLQSPIAGEVDAIWLVDCSPATSERRLAHSRGLSEDQIRTRLASMPSFDDGRMGDVIVNDGSMEELEVSVAVAWRRLTEPS